MGFICDATGQMQRLLKYLREKEELPFLNPYNTSRWIYVFHCMTHNLKNMRTQTWNSKHEGSKLFMDVDEVHFGKDIFQDPWLRDEERADRNALRETDIRQGAIELDKWNKMNAKFAKAPFSIKTLTEIMKHLYLHLGVSRDEMYRVADHPTRYIGYFSTVAKKMKDIVNKKDLGSRLASQVSSFEFAACISELYNQCVLNMTQLIT